MNQEDAIRSIIHYLKNGLPYEWPTFGYDMYVPRIIDAYLMQEKGLKLNEARKRTREFSPYFFDAAWELCRRGILRPGVRILGDQATDEGHAGCGYSITPFGKAWLEEGEDQIFVPTEPERFGELLKPYKERFGQGFYERSQQAIRCYGAHAYLACCAMAGAAAESIMLAIACEIEDEPKVLKIYSSASGRRRIENMVIGKAKKQISSTFSSCTDLLKYWRDESAHGKASKISDTEAHTAIALLLRFAQSVNDYWEELIVKS